ncbi:MAG: hypothetical protein ONB31_07315 [candidate division KSB1 bacterium]|nr:hypothetical protein [candidate division KSB1 bacterium]
MHNADQKSNPIPSSLARLFQEYDFEQMDAELYAQPIIERTLEMGTWEELHWLFHHYGLKRIVEYLQQYGHRRLSKMTFNYWCKLLDIREYRQAPFAEIREHVWGD